MPLGAAYGHSLELQDYIKRNPPRVGRETVTGRVVLERRVVHIPDCRADPEYHYVEQVEDFRAILGVPLLREGVPIGVIIVSRTDARPFTPRQIDLVTTFADQAVIAIENVRLLQELQARNRDLSRGPGAADSNQRGAQHYRTLTRRLGAGVPSDPCQHHALVRGQYCCAFLIRWRSPQHGGELRDDTGLRRTSRT